MKYSITVFFFIFSISVLAQPTVREQFLKIENVAQAQKYIDANAPLKPVLMNLSYGKDTTLIDKRLLKQKKGDIFSVGYVTYKVIDATESVQYRSSYIFLDGSSLSVSEVDSLKKIITKKITDGAAFDKLSDEYTMDGNNTKGDTGWFFGEETVPKELQEGVKNHKLGEVFYVDVPDRQWHYIVKKTFDDQVKKDITVLRANGR